LKIILIFKELLKELKSIAMNQEDKTRCTNCKCWRIPDDFVGKLGNVVKRCLKCREKDAKQKKRPDVLEKSRKRNNEKKYYVTHREKKREEDEGFFLEHNAEIMRKWCANNKEHLAKWRTKNFCNRFFSIKSQAQKKRIIWSDNLTDEICYKMMTSSCFYCGFISDETLNGIDRMDGMGSYEESNCVSCCKNCNFIKGSLDPITFINRCQHISKHFGGDGEYNNDIWADSKSVAYKSYLERASKKDLEFTLTKEQFSNLVNANCYYCYKINTDIGVDRKDNSLGYITDNCVTCCGECNYMKGSLNDVEFINLCKGISKFCIETDLQFDETIGKCDRQISKRQKQEVSQEKFVITKQQPNKEKEVKEKVEEYIPMEREYKSGSNLPHNFNFELPKYCYYVPATESKGDGFTCGRLHPKHSKDWTTTRKRGVSTEEKYKQLLAYVNGTEYTKPLVEKSFLKEAMPVNLDKKLELLSKNQLMEVMKKKQEEKTTEEVSKWIKETIPRTVVSKIWNGELDLPEDIKATDEFKDMMKNTKKRTVKASKFTEEEIRWLKDSNLDKSLGERTKLFEHKFGKTITKTYISKLC
jgi:hypothetical protein